MNKLLILIFLLFNFPVSGCKKECVKYEKKIIEVKNYKGCDRINEECLNKAYYFSSLKTCKKLYVDCKNEMKNGK